MCSCRDFDTTNLHTHGLHISGEAPGDDIFTVVEPGASYSYTYHIPDDHMGGTFWYHPHHHGSTSVHAGGGAAGLLIVDDPAGTLPDSVAVLGEMDFVLMHMNMPNLIAVATQFETNCVILGGTAGQCADNFWGAGPTSGTATNVILVTKAALQPSALVRRAPCTDHLRHDLRRVWANFPSPLPPAPSAHVLHLMTSLSPSSSPLNPQVNGMTQPVIPLVADRWYRWRMVYAAVDSTIEPSLDGCEVKLLAKDGIYLPSAPRDITSGLMAPGNRADWLVRCPAGTYTWSVGAAGGRRLQKGGGGGPGNEPMSQDLATVQVTADGDTQCSLPTFEVNRPCYLVDLKGTAADQTQSIRMGPVPNINDVSFTSETTYLASLTAGTVIQYDLGGVAAHPFHNHINSFQLTTDAVDTHGNYFLAGDWHDVMLLPEGAGEISVRLQTDRLTGKNVRSILLLRGDRMAARGWWAVCGAGRGGGKERALDYPSPFCS